MADHASTVSAHRARVLSWRDVLDGHVFQAVCPSCRWEGDVTSSDLRARMQSRSHNNQPTEGKP